MCVILKTDTLSHYLIQQVWPRPFVLHKINREAEYNKASEFFFFLSSSEDIFFIAFRERGRESVREKEKEKEM